MSTDYTITTETTRVIVLRLTEQQARMLIGDIQDNMDEFLKFRAELRMALDGHPVPAAPRKHGPALTIKRQPRQQRQPRQPKAEKPAAADPAKKAKARLTCAHCGSEFSSQAFLARHLLRMHQDAPVAASAADE